MSDCRGSTGLHVVLYVVMFVVVVVDSSLTDKQLDALDTVKGGRGTTTEVCVCVCVCVCVFVCVVLHVVCMLMKLRHQKRQSV